MTWIAGRHNGPVANGTVSAPYETWFNVAPMSTLRLSFSSDLPASADEVWAHASTMDGVNAELGPWIRMTVPRAARGKGLADVEVGREAFASVLMLFGVLPFDLHHLTLERKVERGFDEESWSWMQRRWRHERRVEPTTDGCVVTDRLTIVPRLAPRFLLEPIVRHLFEARHAKLRQMFGGDHTQTETF